MVQINSLKISIETKLCSKRKTNPNLVRNEIAWECIDGDFGVELITCICFHLYITGSAGENLLDNARKID